jgi:hypothetical protein
MPKMASISNEFHDDRIDDVVLVTQLPSQSWFEGFAMRPNGHILATRLDEPELYTWDPADADTEPRLIYRFPKCGGVINLAALPGKVDTYVIITGVMNMVDVVGEDVVLWEAVLDPAEPFAEPRLTPILDLTQTEMPIGVTPVSGDTLLLADSFGAAIWAVDLPTRAMTLLVADDSMKAASAEEAFGINRMRIVDGHIWFTNSSRGIIGRIPIGPEPADGEHQGRGVVLANDPSEPAVQVVIEGLVHCDGLVVLPDGSAAYTAAYNEGLLWKVDINKATHEGTVSTIMSNLVSPTALEMVVTEDGTSRLFIICCGEIDPCWVTATDSLSWSDFKALSECITSVTTTTTEVVST